MYDVYTWINVDDPYVTATKLIYTFIYGSSIHAYMHACMQLNDVRAFEIVWPRSTWLIKLARRSRSECMLGKKPWHAAPGFAWGLQSNVSNDNSHCMQHAACMHYFCMQHMYMHMEKVLAS